MSKSNCNPYSDKVRIISSCDRPVYVKNCGGEADSEVAKEIANLNETMKSFSPSNLDDKLGKGLHKNEENGKIDIKVDGTTIDFDSNGALHAILPEMLDKVVTDVTLQQGGGTAKLIYTVANGEPIEVDVSALAKDIKLTGATYDAKSTILTLSREGNADITVDLGKLAESSTANTNSVTMSGKGATADPLKAEVNVSKDAGNKVETKSDGLFVSGELRVVTDYSKLPQGFLAELITGIGQPLSVTNGSGGPGGSAADLYDKRGRDVVWASLGKPEDNVLANPKLRAKLDGYNPSWYTSSRELSRIINESGEYINSPSDFTDYIEVLEHIPTGLYFPATRPNAEQRSITVSKVRYLNIKETELTKENIPDSNIEPTGDNVPNDIKEDKERSPSRFGDIHDTYGGSEANRTVTGRYLSQGDLEVTFELPSDISKEDFESLMVNRFNQPTESKAEKSTRDLRYEDKYLGAPLDLRKRSEGGYDYNPAESWIEYNGNRQQYRFGVPFISLNKYDLPIGYDDMNQVITERDGKTFVTVTFTNYSILSDRYRLNGKEEPAEYGGFMEYKLSRDTVKKNGDEYVVDESLRNYPYDRDRKYVDHPGLEGKPLLQFNSKARIDGLFKSLKVDTPNTETYPVTYTKASE